MALMLLPAYPYLSNREEDREDCAIKGTLRCDCGSEIFRIYHNGKQAHLLLGSWYSNWIKASGETLLIDARCAACGRIVHLHCDDRSEDGWRMPENEKMTEFVHPKLHDQRVQIEVAYQWEEGAVSDEWHAAYTDFILDAWNDAHPRKIRIFE